MYTNHVHLTQIYWLFFIKIRITFELNTTNVLYPKQRETPLTNTL